MALHIRRCENETETLERFKVADAGAYASIGAAWAVVEDGSVNGVFCAVPRPPGPELHFDLSSVQDKAGACRLLREELRERGIRRVTAWCYESARHVCIFAVRAGLNPLYRYGGKVWFEGMI